MTHHDSTAYTYPAHWSPRKLNLRKEGFTSILRGSGEPPDIIAERVCAPARLVPMGDL
jgi:hypothetical protein